VKISAGAVTADKIATNAITAVKITAGAITAGKIAAGAVLAESIGTNQVIANTANIKDGIITNAKIGSLAADKIIAGTITAAINIIAPVLQNTAGTGPDVILDMANKLFRMRAANGDFSFMTPALIGCNVAHGVNSGDYVQISPGIIIFYDASNPSNNLLWENGTLTLPNACVDTLHIGPDAISATVYSLFAAISMNAAALGLNSTAYTYTKDIATFYLDCEAGQPVLYEIRLKGLMMAHTHYHATDTMYYEISENNTVKVTKTIGSIYKPTAQNEHCILINGDLCHLHDLIDFLLSGAFTPTYSGNRTIKLSVRYTSNYILKYHDDNNLEISGGSAKFQNIKR
jgi:hypothetical protein